MEKGGGFVVVVLLWGGILYILFHSYLMAGVSGQHKLFGSALDNIGKNENSLGEQTEDIGILQNNEDKDVFRKATIHFNEQIDISGIEVSSGASGLIFAGSNRGLFVSRNAGSDWYAFSDLEHVIGEGTAVYKIIAGKSRSFISVFQNGKGTIYGSADNFSTLEKIFEIEGEAIYDFDYFSGNLYLGLSDGRLLFYSVSKNESRIIRDFNSPILGLESFRDGNLIYLVLKSGFWKSQDSGQSFSRMNFLDGYRGANKISGFFPSLYDYYTVYAATDYGLIKSSDKGSSWKSFKTMPSEEKKVSALAYLDNSGEIFAASSDGKIYKSRDSGLNWRTIETDFSRRTISVLKPVGDKIIVGTTKKPLLNLNFSF